MGVGSEVRLDTFMFAPETGRMGLALQFVRGMAINVSGQIASWRPLTPSARHPGGHARRARHDARGPRLGIAMARVPCSCFSATVTTACAAKHTPPPALPQAPAKTASQDLVVLLPDPGSGRVGRAMVTAAGGTVTLAAARDATTVSGTQPPTAVTPLAARRCEKLFGGALASMPLAPRHFTVYFKFQSKNSRSRAGRSCARCCRP